HDQPVQSAGRYCYWSDLYGDYPVLFCVRGYSAGAGYGRTGAASQCSLYPVWTEYRYMYHSCAGIYWYKDKRKAHHDHSPDVQYYWICSVYDHFDRHTVCGYYGDNSTGEPGGPDCKCAYNL